MAFLATASLGAIWASCAPEFGARSVIDRFGQIEPKRAAGGGRLRLRRQGHRPPRPRSPRSARACPRSRPSSTCPTATEHFARHARLGRAAGRTRRARRSNRWTSPTRCACCSPPAPRANRRRSCTSHGGILLEHLKNHALSWDLRPGDRILWFSTTAWMMWNALVSALLGARVDRDDRRQPAAPGPALAVAAGRGDRRHADGGQPRVPDGLPERRRGTRDGVRSVAAAADRRGREPVATRGLPVGVRPVRTGRPAQRGQRWHRRVQRDRAG